MINQEMIMWVSGVLLVIFILSGIRIIRPTERGLVERLGKYKHFAQPGCTAQGPGRELGRTGSPSDKE